ncbi:band 4.1-like protein 4A isoform X2 [Aplysia californica]|uniref:Band 4.1-like protein 4A isoform X2 n=1 Tax=Aplysia californica TaxID=6500 RepID=A0ABM0JWS8_APLCA|nr:band 4.1-like protein 4A isoform X2 [Aplysia californica]
MSKGGRLSRLIPKFFRSGNKDKTDGKSPDSFGPVCLMSFLDDTEQRVSYKNNWKGQMLLDIACDMINLLEKDYFGLRFVDDTGQVHWVDPSRSLSSQVKGCALPFKVYFCVKFYAADPCKLKEEITRYLFFLQIKRDILQGRLPVTFEEASELCAYAVQSELGDFVPRQHTAGYVSEFCFVPNQSEELEARIAAIHRRCIGATPLMAEHRFLEKVKWLEMYGVDLHPVQGESAVEYFLGLTPTGVVVYKHKMKVASYFWPRVTKATFKGKTFIVKVKDKSNDEHTYAFELSTKAACKHLWKCCVEHHAFFRFSQAMDKEARPRKVLRSLSNASSRGRSERLAAGNDLRSSGQEPSVLRVPSRRQPRRVNSDSRLNNQAYREPYPRPDVGMITSMGQPEPVRAPRHRSLPELQGRESPRSVKSAPWESKFDHGLYTSGHDSPTSGPSERHVQGRHGRAVSGSDSESGFSQRKKYFPGRKGSDNDSDISPSRRRRREIDSDSDSDVSLSNSGQGRRKHNFQSPKDHNKNSVRMLFPLTDKENRQNGSIPSLHSAPAGEVKQRRRRRRSKSPGNTKRPPEELKQHIEFDLVETEGMTEDQLMDIPYTKVETKASLFRVKYSPKFRQKIWASRRKSFGEADRNSEPMQRARSDGEGISRQDSNNTEPTRRPSRYDTQSQPWAEDLNQQSPYGHTAMPSAASRRTTGDLHPRDQHFHPSDNRRSSRVSGYRPEGRYSDQGWQYDQRAPQPSPRGEGTPGSARSGSLQNAQHSSSTAYPNPVYFNNNDASSSFHGKNLEDRDSYSRRAYPDRNTSDFSSQRQAPPPSYRSPPISSPQQQQQHLSGTSSVGRALSNHSSRPQINPAVFSGDLHGYRSPQGSNYPQPRPSQDRTSSPVRGRTMMSPQMGGSPPRVNTSHYAGNIRDSSPVRGTQRSVTYDSANTPPRQMGTGGYYDHHHHFPNSRQALDFSGNSATTPARSQYHHLGMMDSGHPGQSPSSSGYSGSHSHQSGTPASNMSPQQSRDANSYNARLSQYDHQYMASHQGRGQSSHSNQPSGSSFSSDRQQQLGQHNMYMRPPHMAAYRSDLVTEL